MHARPRPTHLLLLVALALGAVSCRSGPPRVHKRHLAVLPMGTLRGSLSIADDGETYAFTERTADGQRVIANGVAGPVYPECSAPLFSPAARRLFYWTRDPARAGLTLVIDGTLLATDFTRPGTLVFSKDGLHWAVSGAVGVGGEQSVVVLADGRALGRYPDASPATWSPDGTHVAYLARGVAGDVALLVDDSVRRTFAPPAGTAGTLLATAPAATTQSVVRYLSDGNLFVLARDRDDWVALKNDTRLASYGTSRVTRTAVQITPDDAANRAATIVADSVVLAESAPVVAWWERLPGDEERWRVVRDGVPVDDTVCARFWESQPPAISADGRHLAYPCFGKTVFGQDEGFVVTGSTRHGPYRNVWGSRFSDDGARLAWAAADEGPLLPWSYYVDGRRYRLRFDQVWRPRFDPAARHIAWAAQRGPRPHLGIDDVELAAFDDVLWGPKWTAPATVSWVIRRGRKVSRLDAALP